MVVQAAVRASKNVIKGYSSTQKKTRACTSNDPSPPNTRDMNELASLSYNSIDFIEIMEVIDKRLNDRGKLWRHVFKALTVLEYLLLYGSDNVFRYCEDNVYELKTLREFQHIDDNGIDQGMNVRQVAKDITNLVLNPQTLRAKRQRGGVADSPQRNTDSYRRPSRDRADDGAQRADSRRPDRRETAEDRDLQRAIALSKEEEEKRKAAVAKANQSVFNDLEQAKKDDPLIDLSDIQITPAAPLQIQYTQIQPQYTVQPQYTQVQPQYTQFQPQYTYSNPYDAQIQQEAMQAEYLRQQAEWAALQQQQQMQVAQAQQQEEMLRQQQYLQYQRTSLSPQQPQTTGIGSNNPFAFAPSPSPSLSTTASTSSITAPSTPYSARSLSRNTDERHSDLASIYATRSDDGIDTFGNTGLLRFGPTDTGRVAAQKTGATGAGYLYPQVTAQSVY